MAGHGGKLLVESLAALGATHAFGVPGESYLAVLDALHDTKGRFDFVNARHEGGASFMAAAWGKLTRTPGIAMVTRGPGATNAAIGVHAAMQDSAPMILLVGQIGTHMRGREAFQELDYKAVFGTMAKWAVEIDHVERIPEILARAWKTALTGRPGPVVIALPEDMLSSPTTKAPLTGPTDYPEPAPTPETMTKVRAILAKAARPLILYGGCNWQAEGMGALENFAQASDIPVISAFRYHDQFNNHSPCFCGEAGVGMTPAVRKLLTEADTILAINNRFGENSTDGWTLLDVPVPKAALIHVHGSDLELGKTYQPTLGIQAGPNAFAKALATQPVSGDWADWRAAARADWEAGLHVDDQPSPVDMGRVMTHLNEHLPKDVIITNGAGNFAIWPGKYFRFGPEAQLLATQAGAMGYGIPAAIAACIAAPKRQVICFAGDGDFQMTSQELATAADQDARPIILIVNNGTYGTIRAHQERNYPDRVSGTDLSNPDFVALAKAYGFFAQRVETTAEFAKSFEAARASGKGAVLDLNVSAEALSPRASLSAIRTAGRKAGRKAQGG